MKLRRKKRVEEWWWLENGIRKKLVVGDEQ